MVDLGAFEAHVRRHFYADELSVPELTGLYEQWRSMLADRAQMYALADAFLPENRLGEGQSWWEEQEGDPRAIRAPSTLDYASVMLVIDDGRHGVRARPYCPASLSGRWTLTAESQDGRVETAPGTARRWLLAPDGGLDTGDPHQSGWTWRVRRGRYDALWFGPQRRPAQERRTITRRDGERVAVSMPTAWRGHQVWQVTR